MTERGLTIDSREYGPAGLAATAWPAWLFVLQVSSEQLPLMTLPNQCQRPSLPSRG